MTEDSVLCDNNILKPDASNYDALLERMPEMEERLGIRFDHLSAVYNRREKELTIYSEVHPITGAKLKCNTDLIIVIYDQNDRIIGRDNTLLAKDNFYNFEVVEMTMYDLTPKKLANIGKIKIYPAQW